MLTPQRLEDIRRFHDLLRATLVHDPEPLTALQRQVVVDMMNELIEHAKETTAQDNNTLPEDG